MERQEAVLFGGARMVGSCFISNPALASITEQKKPAVPLRGRRASCRFGCVQSRQRRLTSACENALEVDEAWRMGGGVEIAPTCGSAPARRITVARIATACRALAIEDEFDGKSIRLRLQEHGSAGSISLAHDAPPFRRDGRGSGNLWRLPGSRGRAERLGERRPLSAHSGWWRGLRS
jgi:hypothetical protein